MLRSYLSLPRSVHVLCVGTLINRAGTLLMLFLALYLQSELDLSIETITRIMGTFGLGAIGAALVGGHLADVMGRKRVMVGSLAGAAVVLGCFPLLRSPVAVVGGLLLLAFIGEMYRPATQAMIADLVEPQIRPRAFTLLYVSVNLGFGIAPLVGGLIAKVGFRWLCWVDGLTSGVYALIVLLLIHETQRAPVPLANERVAAGAQEHQALRPAADAAATVTARAAARHILHDGTMLAFAGSTFLMAMCFMQSFSTFPLFLRQRGIDAAGFGRILSLNGFMITFLQLPLTHLLERRRRDLVAVAGMLLIGAGFGLNAVAHGARQFAGAVAVWTFGEMLHASVAPTIVSELSPPSLRGRYMGVFGMCFSIANMLAAPLGGIILARHGGKGLWGAMFGLAVGGALLCALAGPGIVRRASRRERPAPAAAAA
jgi:MFS family permease